MVFIIGRIKVMAILAILFIFGFYSGEHFDPANLYLADIDGNGSANIIYAHSDYLDIYINQSGNRFQSRLNYRYPKASAMIIPVNCNLRIFREMVWIV